MAVSTRTPACAAVALGLWMAGAAEARAAVVLATPATPSVGGVLTVRVSELPARRGLTVRLGGERARRTSTGAGGRAAVRLGVSSRGRPGMRLLHVRAGRARVTVALRVARGRPGRAVLAALSTGERFVISAGSGRAGSALLLTATRLRPRARASAWLGGWALGSARADARGRWRLAVAVPDVGPGAHTLSVRSSGRRVRLRFTVLAPATAAPVPGPAPIPAPRPPGPLDTVTVAAAGDIACGPADGRFNGGAGAAVACRQAATADVVAALAPTAVLPLGDTQYEAATAAEYAGSYRPTWGRFDAIAHPVPGDHEYLTPGAAGYFAYFGAAAGDPGRGYGSFDLGAWHLIGLNSNCAQVSCAVGSAQEQWLRADLAAHPNACTLAYWHDPRFSSGQAGQATDTDPFWRALYAAGAELVLSGHSHTYERFAPQTPDRAADPARGVRQLVVGTGGEGHQAITTVRPNSQVRNADTFGVLSLTLRPGGYDWRFVPEAGRTFTDTGSASCH